MDGVTAARYCYHAVVAHKYAVAVLHGLSQEDANRFYDEAMRNFDQIVNAAMAGKSQEANLAEMNKGAAAMKDILDGKR